jgi:dihydrofolate reductase
MRALTAEFFMSVDGFAAEADAGQSCFMRFFGPEMTRYVQRVLDAPQVIVIGRKTYQLLSGFWATANGPQAGRMNNLPKIVFSRTLKEPLAWNNSRLAKGDFGDEIRALKRQPGDPIRLIGSVKLVEALIRLNLVDRLRLVVFPLVLGDSGREAIFNSYVQTRLQLVRTTVLDSNVNVLEYQPLPNAHATNERPEPARPTLS